MMKNPELILHIGTSKTGTTALQHTLMKNRERLIKRGIYYFRDNQNVSSSWIYEPSLRWQIKDIDNVDLSRFITASKTIALESVRDCCIRIRAAFFLSGCSKLVISEEVLFHTDYFNTLKVIKDVFYDFRVRVVCYLRRQDKYIESLFDQKIKYLISNISMSKIQYNRNQKHTFEFIGLLPEFNNFINRKVEHLDYLSKIRCFVSLFENESFCVRTYESGALINDDIVQDFLVSALTLPYNFYKTLDINGIKKNDIRLGKNLAKMKLEGNAYNHNLYTDIAIGLGNKYKNINYFTDSARAEFLDYFKKGNEILARDFLDREDGVLFHEPVELYDHIDNASESFESDVLSVLINSTHINSVSGSCYKFTHFPFVIGQILDYASTHSKTVLLYGVRSRTAESIINLIQRFASSTKLIVSDKKLLSHKVMIEGRVVNSCQFSEIKDSNPDYIILLLSDPFVGKEVYNEIKLLELDNSIIFPCYDFSDMSWKTYMIDVKD